MAEVISAPNLAARAGYEGWVTPIISSWDCLMGRILNDGSECWWNDGYHPCDHPNFWWDVWPNDLVLHIPPHCSCLPHVQIPYARGTKHKSSIYGFLIYPYIIFFNTHTLYWCFIQLISQNYLLTIPYSSHKFTEFYLFDYHFPDDLKPGWNPQLDTLRAEVLECLGAVEVLVGF
jgi:hypothetical protein